VNPRPETAPPEGDSVACTNPRCGRLIAVGLQRCPGCGTFQRANTLSMHHGGYSKLARRVLMPEQASRLRTIEQRRVRLTKELGQVGVLKTDLAERYLEVEAIAAMLGATLVGQGVTTGKGYTRRALIAYLDVQQRQVHLAGLLGLDRRGPEKRQKGARTSLAEHEARVLEARDQTTGASE